MSDIKDLEWLSEDQRTTLAERWGSDWERHFADHLALRHELAGRSADELRLWLTELLEGTGFRWATTGQRARLDGLTSLGPWSQWLPAKLDAGLSGWDRKGPWEIADWLDRELPGYEHRQASRAFTWVPAAYAARLDPLTTHGPWRTWLLTVLDKEWDRWDTADAGQQVQWLNTWLVHLEATYGAPAAPTPAEPDPRDFGWATGDHGVRVRALPADARRALVKTLDEKWPGWERSALADRLKFLDGWLPHFEATTAPATAAPAEPVVAEPVVAGPVKAEPAFVEPVLIAEAAAAAEAAEAAAAENVAVYDEFFEEVVRPVLDDEEFADLSAEEIAEAIEQLHAQLQAQHQTQ